MSRVTPFSAEAHLAAIIESSDDAIVSKDLNSIVMSWNPAAERLFGYTADEMIGQSITKIIPPERLAEEDFVLSRVRAGLRVEHFETVRRDKYGRDIDVSLAVSPVLDASGRIIGASKIARDISEHKRLLEAQQRAIAWEEAERVRALEAENRRIQEHSRLKSEFVANMSHELRTPLNSIMGFAEMIEDEKMGPVPPRYKRYAGLILSSSRHLLQLINDILDLAKVESGAIDLQPEWIDLPLVVGEVKATTGALARERGIEVALDLDLAVQRVCLDPTRLKQVLYNYLSNAIKFSSNGGRVVVRSRAEGDAGFRIEVQDWGIGIREEDFARLFVEFQQLDASTTKRHEGTGLGLSLTKRIVEAQGGRVGFQSKYGEGSTFFAVLPREVVARSAELTARTMDAEEVP